MCLIQEPWFSLTKSSSGGLQEKLPKQLESNSKIIEEVAPSAHGHAYSGALVEIRSSARSQRSPIEEHRIRCDESKDVSEKNITLSSLARLQCASGNCRYRNGNLIPNPSRNQNASPRNALREQRYHIPCNWPNLDIWTALRRSNAPIKKLLILPCSHTTST